MYTQHARLVVKSIITLGSFSIHSAVTGIVHPMSSSYPLDPPDCAATAGSSPEAMLLGGSSHATDSTAPAPTDDYQRVSLLVGLRLTLL